jgi:hypothetical protein
MFALGEEQTSQTGAATIVLDPIGGIIGATIAHSSLASRNPFFLLWFRLPHSFCVLNQAQKYCSLVLVGLFRKQLVKVLDIALSNDFIDHGLALK